jgi:two-component system, NtrC family, sensor kinase
LALLAAREFAVLLLDVNMPDMDGFTVAEQARRQPLGKALPIVFVTASDKTDQGMLRGYDSGAVDFLYKPVQRDVLRSKVRVFVELFEARLEIAQTRDALQRSNAELRELAATKQAMAEDARRAKKELEHAYFNLQQTQADLVQSAKMGAIGELVAGIAHEINNPLAYCLAHSSTLQRGLDTVLGDLAPESAAGGLPSKLQNRFHELRLGLVRIDEIVKKLQTFARYSSCDYDVVNIGQCVDAIVTLQKHRAGARVVVNTEIDDTDQLRCFPTLLNQCLMNLVQNAIEAIVGEGTVIISGTREGAEYVLRIRDNGCGVAGEIRDRIFEPFFTTKAEKGGQGLGLPVAYSVARSHGGTLELNATDDGGTEVTLRLAITASQRTPAPELTLSNVIATSAS